MNVENSFTENNSQNCNGTNSDITENSSSIPQLSENQNDVTQDIFGKPDCYDYSDLSLPENFNYDEELLSEFNLLASKYNLSQKSANELMQIAFKLAQKTSDNFKNDFELKQIEKINLYKKMLNDDKEIGGHNLQDSLRVANIAYDSFANDRVRELFSQTGLNLHPDIVKMFGKIGAKMQNDTFYEAKTPVPCKENREDILFPTMK